MISVNRCLQPPVESYLPQGVSIKCELVSSIDLLSERVTVTYRLVDLERGDVHVESVNSPVLESTDYYQLFTVIGNLPECFVFSLDVSCAVAEMRGETFVKVTLHDKTGRKLTTLLAGYVTYRRGLAYPPIHIEDSAVPPGKLISGGDAGFPLTFAVPPYRLRVLRSVRFTLTTSAVEADRIPYIAFADEGETVFFELESPLGQPASSVFVYNFVLGGDTRSVIQPGTTDVTHVQICLPDLRLLPLQAVEMDVYNSDEDDNPGPVTLWYEELLLTDYHVEVA